MRVQIAVACFPNGVCALSVFILCLFCLLQLGLPASLSWPVACEPFDPISGHAWPENFNLLQLVFELIAIWCYSEIGVSLNRAGNVTTLSCRKFFGE